MSVGPMGRLLSKICLQTAEEFDLLVHLLLAELKSGLHAGERLPGLLPNFRVTRSRTLHFPYFATLPSPSYPSLPFVCPGLRCFAACALGGWACRPTSVCLARLQSERINQGAARSERRRAEAFWGVKFQEFFILKRVKCKGLTSLVNYVHPCAQPALRPVD